MFVVTGGAGFIGSVLISKLNSVGIKDILVVDNLSKSDKWKNLIGKSFSNYIHKDDFIEMIMENQYTGEISCIIHLGACSSTTEKDADYLMENNYRYSKVLATWAIENKVKMIYASSAATYGDGSLGFSDNIIDELKPLNMYGFSKHLFDLWAIESEADKFLTGLKFFNVFGPNEYHKAGQYSIVYNAFKQIINTGEMKLFKSENIDYDDGMQLRDFIYVKDVVDIIWWLIQHQEVCGIFNIGTGIAKSWLEITSNVFKAMDKSPNIKFVDLPDSLKEHYQYFTQADISKLIKAGYDKDFTSLEDSVKDYIQNYLLQDKKYE